MSVITAKLLSSMNKCFNNSNLDEKTAISSLSMLKNERLSFQLALSSTGRDDVYLEIEGFPTDKLTLARIGHVPVAITGACDEYYLTSDSGLYPDILEPMKYGEIIIAPAGGRVVSTMITIEDKDGLEPGDYKLVFKLTVNGELTELKLALHVVDAMLPEQSLIHTQWFHNDCIATYYHCDVFSERHWELIGNYMEAAVHCGVNMLLTPVLTPPLDTAVGHERPTVQLVDIKVVDGGYEFGYEKLERYIKLALSKGIKYLEISHLFSQWGAVHAPKVVAEVDGEVKRIFGWDTDAVGDEYKTFIRAFVSGLLAKLKELGVDKQCYFHISDEPQLTQLESYTASKSVVADLLADYTIMDALSNYEFYADGVVECPIPATNHIVPFLENNVPDLWTYYCCGQTNLVSNRMLAMPGQRTRILGEQLYKFDIKGFLQWGFNFWYSRGSMIPINPYTDVCGGEWVPGGDTFSVYPGVDGKAIYSLHALHFYEGLQDQRALALLEKKLGRDAVVKLIDYGCGEPMTFASYPRSASYILALRELVNKLIEG